MSEALSKKDMLPYGKREDNYSMQSADEAAVRGLTGQNALFMVN